MRMSERMKKVFSILLCLCMLVQNTPVVAFAAGEDNLCAHHTQHTAACGDAEGQSDCTYHCHICHVQGLVNALPDEVTAENLEAVMAQLTAIDVAILELPDEEQTRVDFAKYSAAISAINVLQGQPGAEVPMPAMEIAVKVADGTTYTLQVEPNDTIAAIKKKVHAQEESLLPEMFDLVFAGKILDDSKTLSDYNIQKESTIHLVLKMVVTVVSSENGTVTAPQYAREGETVTLAATPAEGYQLDRFVVKDKTTGASITVTNNTFEMPDADVEVYAVFEPIPAAVTGMSITVDGTEYTGSSKVYITPDTQTVTLKLYGTYLNHMEVSDAVQLGSHDYNRDADWVISTDRTTATLAIAPSTLTDLAEDVLHFHSLNGSCDPEIYVIYLSDAGTDLTTIYFQNATNAGTVKAMFQNCNDVVIANYADMDPVESGAGIFYIAVPKYADKVEFAYDGVYVTVEIPMAAEGKNCYNPSTQAWEHYHTGGTATCTTQAVCDTCGVSYGNLAPDNHASAEFTYTASDDGVTHKKVHKCCEATAAEAENHTGGTATCTTQAVCQHCGASYGDPLGHSTTAEDDRAANCKDLAYCSVCKSEYGEVDTNAHTPDESVGLTCKGYHCTICGEWYGETDLSAHVFAEDNATCKYCQKTIVIKVTRDGVVSYYTDIKDVAPGEKGSGAVLTVLANITLTESMALGYMTLEREGNVTITVPEDYYLSVSSALNTGSAVTWINSVGYSGSVNKDRYIISYRTFERVSGNSYFLLKDHTVESTSVDGGTLDVAEGATLTVTGTMDVSGNRGQIIVNGTLELGANATVANSGTIFLNNTDTYKTGHDIPTGITGGTVKIDGVTYTYVSGGSTDEKDSLPYWTCSDHMGGLSGATCITPGHCENCGDQYEVYSDHTIDTTTGECVHCGKYVAVATVSDGTTTLYARGEQQLRELTEQLLTSGSRTITVVMSKGYMLDDVCTAVRNAVPDEGQTVHLTVEGVTAISEGSGLRGLKQLASLSLPDVTYLYQYALKDTHLQKLELTAEGGITLERDVIDSSYVGSVDLVLCCNKASSVTGGVTWQNTTFRSITYTEHDYESGVCKICGVVCDHSGNTSKPVDAGNGKHSFTCTACSISVTEPHIYTLAAAGNVITATCSANCGCGGTATITATGKTYDGTAVEATVTKDGALAGVNFRIIYAVKDGTTLGSAPVNAGTYTASIGMGENENAVVASVDFTIAKADAFIAAAPMHISGLTYTGEAQNLVYEGEAVGGKMVYSLSENGAYSTNIPQGTNAGEYKVWYYIQGNANHNDSAKYFLSVTIEKADSTLTAPEAITGLIYNGSNQVLVKEGQAVGGALQYSLDNVNWSAEIPAAANAGEYTVWYKVLGDNNHSDVAEQSLTVTIAQMNLAGATVTLSETSFVYDGKSHHPTVTVTLDGFGKLVEGRDYRVFYSGVRKMVNGKPVQWFGDHVDSADCINAGNDYYAVVIGLGNFYTADAFTLYENYVIQPKELTELTFDGLEAWYLYTGEAINPVFTLKDGETVLTEGEDYTVAITDNTDVGAATITVTLQGNYSGTVTKTFEIKTHVHKWSYSADGDTITATCESSIGECPVLNKTVTIQLKAPKNLTYDGEAKTVTVTQTPAGVFTDVPAEITGDWINAGEYTASLTYNGATAKLPFAIDKAGLTITAKDNIVTYGDIPANAGVSYTGFVNNETESVLSGTVVYSYNYEQYGDVGIYKITPSGVTSGNYELTFADGTLTVNTKAATVKANAVSKVYGEKDPILTYQTTGLVNEDKLTGTLVRAEGETVGAYGITVGTLGNPNYSITFTGAKLTVSKRNVTITAKDQTVIYGSAISNAEITSVGLVNGHRVTVKLIPSTANVTMDGVITASAATITADGADVTANYEITCVDGKLVIEPNTAMIDGLTNTTVTSENEADIKTVQSMMENAESVNEDWEEIADRCDALLDRIEAARDAVNTAHTEKVKDVTADNVAYEDKENLKNAMEELESALEDYGSNYTEPEKKAIRDEIRRIDSAMGALENAEGVTDAIDKLPETVEPDDEAETENILETKKRYDGLTDHEQSLVDETAAKKLAELVTALTAYDIVKGDGSKWAKGNGKSLSFTANGPFRKFVQVEVDNEVVNKKYYDAKSGSTVITLKQSYLKKLSAGEHTITVVYTDGETSGTFRIASDSSVPETGDGSRILFWSCGLIVSMTAMVLLLGETRKRRNAK